MFRQYLHQQRDAINQNLPADFWDADAADAAGSRSSGGAEPEQQDHSSAAHRLVYNPESAKHA